MDTTTSAPPLPAPATTRPPLLALAAAAVAVGTGLAVGLLHRAFLPRQVHLLLHILGAVLFLGNVATGAVWLAFAVRDGSVGFLRRALTAINRLDLIFTAPGALLLAINGAALAVPYGGAGGNAWLRWSTIAFVLAGAIWGLVLVPQQLALERRLLDEERAGGAGSRASTGVMRALTRYTVCGALAGLPALASFALMIFRPMGG